MSKANENEGGANENEAGEKSSGLTKAQLVENAIKVIEAKIQAGSMKPTVGEYVRLLELRNEIDAEEPREIKVTWVEPEEMESSTDE